MSDDIKIRLERLLSWALLESALRSGEFDCSSEDHAETAREQAEAEATIRDAIAAIEARREP